MSAPLNSVDPVQVAKRETAARKRERIAEEDLFFIMSSKQGRRFVWSLLESSHVFHTSFRHGEAVESAVFRDGERNGGVKLLARLHRTCAGLYSLMVQETSETEQ